jgi:TonB-dependent SusC/RagA subfamily outer membrane receptor
MLMRPLLLLWIFLLPVICLAQDLKFARKKSYETLVYRIPADSTAKYLKKDSIPLNVYYNRLPDYRVLTDTFDVSALPNGYYLLFSIDGNKITAKIEVNSNLMVYTLNNDKYIQLAVRDKWGNGIDHPKAWINGRTVDYLESAGVFRLRHSVKEDDIIRISSATDTVFINLKVDREAYRSVSKQRWQIFKATKVGKAISFIPGKIRGLFSSRYRYGHRGSIYSGKGFVVFNQPKYKLGDTVKLKAYILTNRNKPSRHTTTAWLQYNNRGNQVKQLLGTISCSSPGAYLDEFLLRDTLLNDATYTVAFKNWKGKTLVQSSFKTEDYVLDEVATYSVRSAKEKYLSTDSIVIIANAKDANGLNLLDARAKLVLLAGKVEDWKKDSVMIADTLFTDEKKLESNGDTRFVFFASGLPKAEMELRAVVSFRNSNNEIQQESVTVHYSPATNELVLRRHEDTVIAEYFVDGKNVIAKGRVEIEGDKLELVKQVTYPVKLKIDPLADEYWFDVENDTTIYENINIDGDGRLISARPATNGDTLGFVLDNPYRVPVFYTVMNGERVIATGKGETAQVEWSTIEKNDRRAYRVKWQYMWSGREERGTAAFGHPYKALNIGIKALPAVFPGQKDTITVSVKDFKGRAAANVNLTAASYNSQFKKDIKIASIPYLAKYRIKTTLERDTYESDDAYINRKYILGRYPEWRKKFSIDTMLFYQALFPDSSYFDAMTILSDYYPQVSVHIVQKGVPQEIFLLYLNRNLVYYYGVTDKKNYTFFTPGGFMQIGVRLHDRFVEIDSIYIQPNYRHEFFFDLDKLPAASTTTMLSNKLTEAEQGQLETSLWQFRSPDNSDNGYVWQSGEAIRINNNYNHIIGPFHKFDSLHYYKPGKFDIRFPFEPGYQYRISPKMVRLERMPVFSKYESPVMLHAKHDFMWTLGDTVLVPPVISYDAPAPMQQITYTTDFRYLYSSAGTGRGKLVFRPEKDTLLRYVIMYPGSDTLPPVVLYSTTRTIYELEPGNYTLLLARQDMKAHTIAVTIKPDQTTYLKTGKWLFRSTGIIDSIAVWQEKQNRPIIVTRDATGISAYTLQADYNKGYHTITGRVTDAKGGKPVPAAAIQLKGASFGVAADNAGNFRLRQLKKGQYFLIVSAIGYAAEELPVNVEDSVTILNISLKIADYEISEVVVTAYGTQKKKDIVYSMTSVNINALAGKVPGVNIRTENGYDLNPYRGNIIMRGTSSINGNRSPLYVIDGIVYDDLPKNIVADDISSIEVLKDAAATAIYGARAADGVIMISTKSKTLRTQFRDYAFWKPQVFTDKDGIAKIAVTYPDNITSWQTCIVGIDRKNRSGIGMSITKAYKPVMAQLSLPQFAIEGDSLSVVTKTLNYTKDKYQVAAGLKLYNDTYVKWNFELPAAESVVKKLGVVAASDTMKFQFGITTSTGFKDGEERNIPVLSKGTEEAAGRFYIVQQDTTIHYAAQRGGETEMYIQNNTMDVLVNELDHLQRYPYYCMEQIASKVKGYMMEKKIREMLKQNFTHQRDMQRLLEKLQKSQHYDGGWSWWEQGNTDLYITNYILQAMLPLKADPMTAMNLRNGYLFLQNRLPGMKRDVLLYSLATLAEAGHVLDYQPYISKIAFDSLDIHQQWMFTRIKQLLQLDYRSEIDQLVAKKIATMTGGMLWGRETYAWYDNHIATTVLAFTVLEKDETYRYLLPMVVQYFLENRTGAYWRNTVESASITSAILPQIIKTNKQFNEPAVIEVKGDTSFIVNHFPFACAFSNNIQRLDLSKRGSGLTFITLYQNWWNKNPEPVADRFNVNTYFEANHMAAVTLKAGERIKMKADITAMQQAEYVMIEIPVPAGCIIVNKRTDGYAQYFKDKIVIFRELLTKGNHQFNIELECRYSGRYTINPAKASLMYFPVFFGRNGMKEIEIK